MKYPKSDEGDESEAWLVSYADMMTLIACFFILMMAFANFDPIGFSVKAEQMSKSFRKEKYKSSSENLEYITEEIAKHPDAKNKPKVTVDEGNLSIIFSSSIIFAKDQHLMDSDSELLLDSMISMIKVIEDDFRVIVEGHSSPYEVGENFSNSLWGLSSARASSIVERFEYYGFEPKELVSVSYGASRFDKGAKDRSNGRRVFIKILRTSRNEKRKIGLGIYFDD